MVSTVADFFRYLQHVMEPAIEDGVYGMNVAARSPAVPGRLEEIVRAS